MFQSNSYINPNAAGKWAFKDSDDSTLSDDLFRYGHVAIGGDLFNAQDTSVRLTVKGGILTEKVLVDMQGRGGEWPDYVLSPEYVLLDLTLLEAFIAKNKHLPDIPSSNEVHANGIELGDMNKRLLKKIEELTLYLINQNKTILELQFELKSLKESIPK